MVVDPEGAIRYIISKSVGSRDREQRQREYIESGHGQRLWKVKVKVKAHAVKPVRELFRLAHAVDRPMDDAAAAPPRSLHQ